MSRITFPLRVLTTKGMINSTRKYLGTTLTLSQGSDIHITLSSNTKALTACLFKQFELVTLLWPTGQAQWKYLLSPK